MTTLNTDNVERTERVNGYQNGTYVELSVEITQNLGNYENIKPRATLGRPLRDGEHPKDAFEALYEVVTDAIANTVDRAKKEMGYK